jgi:hypothetical protein
MQREMSSDEYRSKSMSISMFKVFIKLLYIEGAIQSSFFAAWILDSSMC